jgi:DNA-binding transcriptional MerR regulator
MSLPRESAVTALQLYEPRSGETYSIEMTAGLAQVPRRTVAIYCRHGLISPARDPESGGWQFTDDAIRRIRFIEQLRLGEAMSLAAIRMIVQLSEEVERLRDEVRFLRRL